MNLPNPTPRPDSASRHVRYAPSRALVVCAALLLLPGCRQPPSERPPEQPPAQPPTAPPLALLDQSQWPEEWLLGTSVAEMRRMVKPAIERLVTLTFRSAPLQTVVKELSRQAGLGIGITPGIRTDAKAKRIYLDVRDMPAEYALDWLTRLVGAHYAVEGPRTVFITRDRNWTARGRLEMRSYSLGALSRVSRPVAGRYDRVYEAQRFLSLLRVALRHTMKDHTKARLILDDTCSRLNAVLLPRGHAKLAKILAEIKRPRKYERPDGDKTGEGPAELPATTVMCNFARQDIRQITAELAKQANVNIGFDYELVEERRRNVALALGETTLGSALGAVAKAAGLGEIVVEPGRRLWVFAKNQDPRKVLRTTGMLPWDGAVVRSYYVRQLVRRFGIGLVFKTIQEAVEHGRPGAGPPIALYHIPGRQLTVEKVIRRPGPPGVLDADLPLAFYHNATGRLVVMHNKDSQRIVAEAIEKAMDITRPRRPRRK